MHNDYRHPDADRTLVEIERSDVIDAAAGLLALADKLRREAKLRRNAGPSGGPHRAWLRNGADVYEAAARRVQRAADEAI
jgi:hypothetical protein